MNPAASVSVYVALKGVRCVKPELFGQFIHVLSIA